MVVDSFIVVDSGIIVDSSFLNLSDKPDMHVAISDMPSMISLLSTSMVPIAMRRSSTVCRRFSKSSMETISSQEQPSVGFLVVSAFMQLPSHSANILPHSY